MRLEPFKDGGIFRRRGGAFEQECVGNQSGHHNSREISGRHQVISTIKIGDDRAGGTNGFVYEKNRLRRSHRTQAMVINNLGDGDFISAGHGLGQFIMINQNQPSGDWFEQVSFRDNA